MNQSTTLLFNQNAIAAVTLEPKTESTHAAIRVLYGDGSGREVVILDTDELYEFHYNNFRALVDQNLNPEATPDVE